MMSVIICNKSITAHSLTHTHVHAEKLTLTHTHEITMGKENTSKENSKG